MHHQQRAVDERSRGARQRNDRPDEFLQLAPAPGRHLPDVIPARLGFEMVIVQFGLELAGATVFTRMPYFMRSMLIAPVSWMIAPLDEQYAVCPGYGPVQSL